MYPPWTVAESRNPDGAAVGVEVGVTVGVAVGVTVGVAVGVTVGVAVGVTVEVGVEVGVAVGVAVGATVLDDECDVGDVEEDELVSDEMQGATMIKSQVISG